MDRDIVRVPSFGTPMSRRDLLMRAAVGGAGIAALSSLSGLRSLLDVSAAEADSLGAPHALEKLVAAAKKEGHLNVITLPRDWADYGELMDSFQRTYGIGITDAIPDGSSAQEIQAIRSLKGQSRAPDTVDVGPAFADIGKKAGLFEPYKVATWNTIPSNMKDPGGAWMGDYWGVVSFLGNRSIIKQMPKDWSDLTSPSLRGKVAINGDPRQAGAAFAAVMAASLGNGGSLDNIEPGITFFARLKKLGNFIPASVQPAQIVKGTTPLAIWWDYLNLSARDELVKAGLHGSVVIPSHGVYGGYYCQALSKFAPHPNAGKLWLEYLYSDQGQVLFLKGYTHPARYTDLQRRGKIPKALAARLPAPSHYSNVKFATKDQIDKAAKVLQAEWGPKVAGS